MPHLDPTWQVSAVTAVGLLVLTLALRVARWSRTAAAASEATLVVALYAAWQLIGTLTHRDVHGADANALWVWHAEQAMHLPSELAVQQAVMPHPWLVQLANGYYLYGHFNPIIAMLVWVFVRHRGAYGRVRLLICLVTASAFVVHFVPVAPPRLMPQLGFTDVALQYGQSVYGSFGAGIPGQLLAMPSLHVGWAILLAYVVVTTSRSRWRWLVLAHPVLMTVVVAATANHWWLDGAVCAVLLALCVVLERHLLGSRAPWREPVVASSRPHRRADHGVVPGHDCLVAVPEGASTPGRGPSGRPTAGAGLAPRHPTDLR